MNDFRNVLDLKKRNALRMSLLLLSTFSVLLGTAIVYSRVVFEQALTVGSLGGVSGSIAGLDTFAPVLTVVLVFSGIVAGPSLFIIFRQTSRRTNKPEEQKESVEPSPMFSPLETAVEPEFAPSPENEDDAMKMIRDILHPNREQPTTSE